jgi:hypothetical protein
VPLLAALDAGDPPGEVHAPIPDTVRLMTAVAAATALLRTFVN